MWTKNTFVSFSGACFTKKYFTVSYMTIINERNSKISFYSNCIIFSFNYNRKMKDSVLDTIPNNCCIKHFSYFSLNFVRENSLEQTKIIVYCLQLYDAWMIINVNRCRENLSSTWNFFLSHMIALIVLLLLSILQLRNWEFLNKWLLFETYVALRKRHQLFFPNKNDIICRCQCQSNKGIALQVRTTSNTS